MAVAEADGVPGILRRIAEMEPPVIPAEKSPNRRQIEVTGGRENVSGKRSTIPKEMVRPGDVVFDIGAHVGFYTLLASLLVGSKGVVIAFEPSPRNVQYLKVHLRMNGIKNVTVIEAAVSNCSGSVSFEVDPGSTMGHIDPDGRLMVKAVSLDELYSKGIISIPRCVKIDVEGAEMLVLSGARAILRKAHPTIFLATHGSEIHEQCCRFIRSIGYEVKEVCEGRGLNCREMIAYAAGCRIELEKGL